MERNCILLSHQSSRAPPFIISSSYNFFIVPASTPINDFLMLAFAAPVSPPVSEMEIVVEVSLTKSGVPEHSVKVRLGWEKRMIVDRLQTF